MIEEKDVKIAIVGVVLRGHPTRIREGIASLPLDVEVIQLVRDDLGLQIFATTELAKLVDGAFANLRIGTRKRLWAFHRNHKNDVIKAQESPVPAPDVATVPKLEEAKTP